MVRVEVPKELSNLYIEVLREELIKRTELERLRLEALVLERIIDERGLEPEQAEELTKEIKRGVAKRHGIE